MRDNSKKSRITHRGVHNLLDALTTFPTGISCNECQEQLPQLVDVILSGADPGKIAPEVMAHIDHCKDCESLFLEVLGDMEDLPEPVQNIRSAPDLAFLKQPPAPAIDIWKAVIKTTEKIKRTMSGRLESLQVSFHMMEPPVYAFREDNVEYNVTDQQLNRYILEEQSSKHLYRYGSGPICIVLRAQRQQEEALCRITAIVDRSNADSPNPSLLKGESGTKSWIAPFNKEGLAFIEGVPVKSLAHLNITLCFDEP